MIPPSSSPAALRRLIFPLALFGAVAWAAACGTTEVPGGSDAGTGDDASSWRHEDADASTNDARAPGDAAGDGDVPNDASNGDADRDATTDASALGDAAVDADRDATSLDAATADAADAAIVIDDPFDARSCDGAAMTTAEALVKLGAATRTKLADATLYRRERVCTGADVGTCGPWGAPVPHTQPLLTYSGGVVTDYKTFAFPTHLVLFLQAGQPRFSVRHTSDYRHDAAASTRGVLFSFGATPMVNTYPIIYVWDFAPAPNRYDDLQGLLGSRGELHAAGTCARLVVTSGLSREIVALYRY